MKQQLPLIARICAFVSGCFLSVGLMAGPCTPSATDTSVTVACGDSVMVGSHAYNSPGTYMDTLTNSLGCDSVITLHLTVSTDTIHQFGGICNGDSVYFYGSWIYAAGTYDTVLAGNPCDTTVILTLVVQDPLPPHNISKTICNGDSLLFFGTYLHATGTYSHLGCDTSVSLSLTVLPAFTSSSSETICQGQIYNGHSATGQYTDTFTTVNGCDSMVTLQLTVLPVVQTNLTESICAGSVYPFGNTQLYLSGYYADTLVAANGCDSFVTLHLTVLPNPIQPYIVQQGDTLVSSLGVGYQWYLNDTAVTGQTSATLVATESGNYQVVITGPNGCSTISGVYAYYAAGVQQLGAGFDIKIYPNPNNGKFAVQFNDANAREIVVTDVLGQSITPAQKVYGRGEFDLSTVTAGIYFLKIWDVYNNSAVMFKQIVVQH